MLEDSATSFGVHEKMGGQHRPYPNAGPLDVDRVVDEIGQAIEEISPRIMEIIGRDEAVMSRCREAAEREVRFVRDEQALHQTQWTQGEGTANKRRFILRMLALEKIDVGDGCRRFKRHHRPRMPRG